MSCSYGPGRYDDNYENKGILIAIVAFEEYQKYNPEEKFIVAGEGSALEKAKILCFIRDIKYVFFTGYITSKKKEEIYWSSDHMVVSNIS